MINKNNIIAHRGLFDNNEIPENSIKAFKKALQKNISIELDIQPTKDNILVVFHDYNLKRMTGNNALLQDLTYEQLQRLYLLNTKEKIPTLKEVLQLIDNKVLLDIEIKNTKNIKKICNLLIKELTNYSNYTLKSFHPGIVHYLKKNYPNLKVGYLLGDKNVYQNKLYYLFLSNSIILYYCHPDFIAISKKLWKKKKYKKLQEKYPIYLWTIKRKEEFVDSSLTYICENLPF